MSKSPALYEFDRRMVGAQDVLVGIDEAGRGPLAGPVVAGAVILDLNDPIEGVNDSKKLSAAKRDTLFEQITTRAVAFATGLATVEEIDEHNILQATFLAMRRAVAQIKVQWTLALVDGNLTVPGLPDTQLTVVGGDATSASIAAASILAKVTRDRMMEACHVQFPGYEFDQHKGYGTERHRNLVRTLGLCAAHRKTFCSSLAAEQTHMDFGAPVLQEDA